MGRMRRRIAWVRRATAAMVACCSAMAVVARMVVRAVTADCSAMVALVARRRWPGRPVAGAGTRGCSATAVPVVRVPRARRVLRARRVRLAALAARVVVAGC
jgi:hypothetical protein